MIISRPMPFNYPAAAGARAGRLAVQINTRAENLVRRAEKGSGAKALGEAVRRSDLVGFVWPQPVSFGRHACAGPRLDLPLRRLLLHDKGRQIGREELARAVQLDLAEVGHVQVDHAAFVVAELALLPLVRSPLYDPTAARRSSQKKKDRGDCGPGLSPSVCARRAYWMVSTEPRKPFMAWRMIHFRTRLVS